MSIVVSSILSTYSPLSVANNTANNDAYIGVGLSNLELDGDNSVNFSITTGYNFLKRSFESADIQALTVAIEIEYSDSISGADDVNYYSVFAVFRAYISAQWYVKIKPGYTDFPSVALRNSDAESAHIGAGIGLGYKTNSGSIEVEYIYPNKTIHASVIAISYKYHF